MKKPSVISIIIPTYKRPRLLADCLESIHTAKKPLVNYEILVVDDGGQLTKELEKKYAGPHIKWIYLSTNHGQACAQHIGYQKSRGEILAFLDDDSVIDKNWLLEISRFFTENSDVHCVVGRIEAWDTSHILSRTRQEIYNARHRKYSESTFRNKLINKWNLPLKNDVAYCDQISGGNFAIRKSALDAVHGFKYKGQFCNDSKMTQKLLHAGYAIGYNPDMVIYHKHDTRYRMIYSIAKRKMSQRLAFEKNIHFLSCFQLVFRIIKTPFAIIKHPEMFHADKNKLKVYFVFTYVQLIYSFGELVTFLQLYFRKVVPNNRARLSPEIPSTKLPK